MRGGRALATGVLLAAVLVACGGGPAGVGAGTSGPGTPTPSGPAVERARRDLCHDLLLIQSGFRPDALARLLPKLRDAASGFEQAGDAEDARAVRRLVDAMERLRSAVIKQEGVGPATGAVELVLAHLPDC